MDNLQEDLYSYNGQYNNSTGRNKRRKKRSALPALLLILALLLLGAGAYVLLQGKGVDMLLSVTAEEKEAHAEKTLAHPKKKASAVEANTEDETPAAQEAAEPTATVAAELGLLVTADDSYVYTEGTVIGSEQEFVNAAACLYRAGATTGEFTFSKSFFNGELLIRWGTLAGMETFRCSYSEETRKVTYKDIVWSEKPVLNCRSVDDLGSAVALMSEQGIVDYTLVMDAKLYSRMSGNDCALLLTVLAQQGIYGYDSGSLNEDACSITLCGVKSAAAAPLTETMEDARNYMWEQAALGETHIVLRCSETLYDLLLDEKGENNNGLLRVVELMDAIGAMEGSRYSYDYSSHVIEYQIKYYGGYRMILAHRSGDFSGLTSREKQTYDAAVRLAAELTRSTPLETLYAIHDHLCSSVTYGIDKTTDEDDQAIGAILNGLANCDGYSDAFYLIGTLAGLEVRYTHGNTYGAEITDDPDSTHVWNLVNLNGLWYHVDVTWDDTDDTSTHYAFVHTYVLLGSDRMGLTHYWCSEANVPIAAVTDQSLRPAYEYLVTNDAELRSAAKSAASANHDIIVFVFSSGIKEQWESAFDYLRQYRSYGTLNYFWESDNGALTIFVR